MFSITLIDRIPIAESLINSISVTAYLTPHDSNDQLRSIPKIKAIL